MALVQAAGILPFRRRDGGVEVLLLHLGGPLWAHKDMWHFPKGELDPGEDHLTAAKREYEEEIGSPVPAGELIDLGEANSGSKSNRIWAVEADADLSGFEATLHANTFTMEWPRGSGNFGHYPENDLAEWFSLAQAHTKVFGYLQVTLERLAEHLGVAIEPAEQ